MTALFILIGVAMLGYIFVLAFCRMASTEDSKAEKLFKEQQKNNKR